MTFTVMCHNRRGQSTWEAALLIITIAAAVITMAVFAKRAVSGRLKDAAQSVSDAHYIYGRTSGTHDVTVDLRQIQRFTSGEDGLGGVSQGPDDFLVFPGGPGASTAVIPGIARPNVVPNDFNVFVESRAIESTTTTSNFRVSE